MPVARPQADPFTDAHGALRPTTSNATSLPATSQLRAQTSQASLRSGAGSAASMRSRQNRDLLAPSLSRRAPSRNLRKAEDDVLVDSDTDHDAVTSVPRQPRLRRVRRLSGDARLKTKQGQQAENEMVNRQPDGSFIRDIPGLDEAVRTHEAAPELVDEARMRASDAEYAELAARYFASAPASSVERRALEEQYSELRAPMMGHLRAQVLQVLEDERWRFEPSVP